MLQCTNPTLAREIILNIKNNEKVLKKFVVEMSFLEFSQFRNEKTIINTFKTDEMEKLK